MAKICIAVSPLFLQQKILLLNEGTMVVYCNTVGLVAGIIGTCSRNHVTLLQNPWNDVARIIGLCKEPRALWQNC